MKVFMAVRILLDHDHWYIMSSLEEHSESVLFTSTMKMAIVYVQKSVPTC